jgi:hypothetical protein
VGAALLAAAVERFDVSGTWHPQPSAVESLSASIHLHVLNISYDRM